MDYYIMDCILWTVYYGLYIMDYYIMDYYIMDYYIMDYYLWTLIIIASL